MNTYIFDYLLFEKILNFSCSPWMRVSQSQLSLRQAPMPLKWHIREQQRTLASPPGEVMFSDSMALRKRLPARVTFMMPLRSLLYLSVVLDPGSASGSLGGAFAETDARACTPESPT